MHKGHARRVSSLTYRRRRASGINLMSDLRLLELSLEAANIGTAADASYDYPTACANYAKAVKYFSTIIQRAYPHHAISQSNAEQPGATYIRPPPNCHAMVHPNRCVVDRTEDSHAISLLYNDLAAGLVRSRFPYPPFP